MNHIGIFTNIGNCVCLSEHCAIVYGRRLTFLNDNDGQGYFIIDEYPISRHVVTHKCTGLSLNSVGGAARSGTKLIRYGAALVLTSMKCKLG